MAMSLEKRVQTLEVELAKLKAMMKPSTDVPWWEKIAGTFANDPSYKEASQIGREYRNSLRPKPRKTRKLAKPRHGHT